VVAVLLLVAVPLAQSKTVSITSVAQPGTVTLAAALSDPQVSRAELLADVALDELGWEGQVLVNRSVTVTAAPNVSAVLDFNFLRGKVVLGSAARVTIKGITLRNTR
jgi:nitrous oxidase accessory protein NosD